MKREPKFTNTELEFLVQMFNQNSETNGSTIDIMENNIYWKSQAILKFRKNKATISPDS